MIGNGQNSPFLFWPVADKARAWFVARTVAGRGAAVPRRRPAVPSVPAEKRKRKCDTQYHRDQPTARALRTNAHWATWQSAIAQLISSCLEHHGTESHS